MPPKKTSSKVVSYRDAPAKNEKLEDKEPDVVSVRKVAAHPPTMMMVKEALKELDSRKGVSSQAIKKYILEKHPSVDVVRLKYMLRKALVKGMESGVLVRPVNSTLTSGAQGRFRLAPKKPKEPKLKTAENSDPNALKATKAGAKKVKGTATGAGAEKKKAVIKQKSTEAKADKGAAASKVPAAKKPKDKKVVVDVEEDDAKAPAPKAAAPKAPAPKAAAPKAAKGSKKKDGDKDKAPATKAAGKRGKKTN